MPRSKSSVDVVGQASHLRKTHADLPVGTVKPIRWSPGANAWKPPPPSTNGPDQWPIASLPAELTHRTPDARARSTMPSGVMASPLPSPRPELKKPAEKLTILIPFAIT